MSTRKPTKGLTPAQCIAAAVIARGDTDSVAAEAAGVALSTVKTWRQKPEFLTEINACIVEGQRLIMRKGLALQDKAIRELEKLLDGNAPPHQKAPAIKIALDRFGLDPAVAVEPVPVPVPELESAETVPPAEETLVQIYEAMARIEEARKRPAALAAYDDDEDDEPRVIPGEVVDEDDEAEPVEVGPAQDMTARQTVRGRQTPVPQAEVEKMLKGRSRGLGGSRV